jgi:hypothetical protein
MSTEIFLVVTRGRGLIIQTKGKGLVVIPQKPAKGLLIKDTCATQVKGDTLFVFVRCSEFTILLKLNFSLF